MRAVRNSSRVAIYGLVGAVVGFLGQLSSNSDSIQGIWLALGLLGWASFLISQVGFCTVGLSSRKIAPWLGWFAAWGAVVTAYCFVRITCFAASLSWLGSWEAMAAGLPLLLVADLILCALCLRAVRIRHQGNSAHSLSV